MMLLVSCNQCTYNHALKENVISDGHLGRQKRCYRATRWITVLYLTGVLVSCTAAPIPTPSSTPTLALASLSLDLAPVGSVVYVDGEEKGRTPLTLRLPAGSYALRVERDGYHRWLRDVQLRPGEEVMLVEALRDAVPPVILWDDLPEQAQVGQLIRILVRATDGQQVAQMRLQINGHWVKQAKGPVLEYGWDTHNAEVGTHALVVEASDDSGNVRQESRSLEIIAPATPDPVATPLPTRTTTLPTATTTPQVSAYVTSITLPSYPYESYLGTRQDPRYSFEVTWLNRGAYQATNPQPEPRDLKAVVLENRYLSLMFLPELGGRLYKCTLRSTGQNVFYQNAVLKPSYWGPLARDENWWLAAGGMEWALPVHEHGYEWGQSWAYNIEQQTDRVSIILRDTSAEDRLWAEVRVTLPDDRAYFVVEPSVVNPTSQAVALQFWLNAALTLGSATVSPNTEFILPAERVVVHSTGDPALPAERQVMPWPIHEGRDLSWYRNWRNWLGVFVPGDQQGYAGAYNHDTGLGVVRIFPEAANGLKLFAFGAGFPARSEYTDDGSEYFEIWGGPCKTFWPEDDVVLGPAQSMQWTEIWLPFHGIGGLDRASAELVVRADVRNGQVYAGVAVSRPRRVHFELSWSSKAFHRGSADVSPEAALEVIAPLPDGMALPGELTVQIKDDGGAALLEYTKGIAP
jgi:hypothetical protein